jgi:hypothetical protein
LKNVEEIENPFEKLIENLEEQISFCDKEIEKFNLLKETRKRLLEFYQSRQQELI